MNCPFCNKEMLIEALYIEPPYTYKCSTFNCPLYRLSLSCSENTKTVDILQYEYYHKITNNNQPYIRIHISKLLAGISNLQLNIKINSANDYSNIYQFNIEPISIDQINQAIQDYIALVSKIIENNGLE